MKSKSQAAIEFIIVLGFAFFFLTAFLLVINKNISEKNKEKEESLVKNLALSIQDEINLAVKTTNGYRREFEIPETILGKSYHLSIIENKIYIKTERVAISLPVANVTGNIKTKLNVIRKENDKIYLNNQ